MNAGRFRSALDTTILVAVIAAGFGVSAAMEFGAVRPAVTQGVASLAARATTVVADAKQAMPGSTGSRWAHRRSTTSHRG